MIFLNYQKLIVRNIIIFIFNISCLFNSFKQKVRLLKRKKQKVKDFTEVSLKKKKMEEFLSEVIKSIQVTSLLYCNFSTLMTIKGVYTMAIYNFNNHHSNSLLLFITLTFLSKWISTNFPNRLLLLFRTVFAFPKASSKGFA